MYSLLKPLAAIFLRVPALYSIVIKRQTPIITSINQSPVGEIIVGKIFFNVIICVDIIALLTVSVIDCIILFNCESRNIEIAAIAAAIIAHT